MNISELLRRLQAEHDETAARADSLRGQIEQLTTTLAETEARLAELAATRKVIDGLTPPHHEPAPTETATVYQRIVTAFNEHPGKDGWPSGPQPSPPRGHSIRPTDEP